MKAQTAKPAASNGESDQNPQWTCVACGASYTGPAVYAAACERCGAHELKRIMIRTCPKCGQPTFAGRGQRTVNEHKLAPGWTLATQIWDESPRGPMLIEENSLRGYWVCQSCAYDWEETTSSPPPSKSRP